MIEQELAAALIYDPTTGQIAWRKPGRGRIMGAALGTVITGGYLSISFNRKQYLAHRLAWLLHHGHWPVRHIDHIVPMRAKA